MRHCITYFILWLIVSISSFGQVLQKVNFGMGKCHLARFSPQNDLIAFAVGNKIKLYRSGIKVASFSNHTSKISDFSFDHEGENIVACHLNGYITIWNTKTKTVTHDFRVRDKHVLACKYLESGEKIVVVSANAISLWSVSGEFISEIPAGGVHRALALSKHGRLIGVAGNNHNITLYDGLGNLVREFPVEGQDWISSLAMSPNGKTMASGGIDGTVNLWNIETGSLIETILNTTGRINSLEFSSDSKYLAVGAEFFFILSVNKDQPDVVYRKLDGAILSSSFSPNGKQVCIIEDLVPYAKVYNITDLNIPPVFLFKDEQDNMAPQIYLSNPARIVNDRVNYSNDIIDIQGSIFDDYGVRNLSVNGIQTPIRENGKFIIHIPLMMGETLVTLEASDINGNTGLKRFTINRKDNVELYDPLIARNFLFVVGINSYQHWPMLNNAVNDANDMTSILMNLYNFDLSNTTILKDEQATQNNIYKGLRGLIEKITPKDNLIIYFSGHGHFDEVLNEGYWIPVDADLNAEGEYLPNSSILKIIESINSQHTFLIADACFSGSLFTDTNRGSSGYIDKVEKIQSRWGLASGRLEVVSDGEIGSNSPFARILLSFLKENPKTEFAVGELIQHVKMKVAEESGQTPIGSPLRLSGDEGGEFVFRKKAQPEGKKKE